MSKLFTSVAITIAGIHCSLVKFYDSKYRSLSEDAIEQIALITQPSHNFINKC